jgi:thiopurine S-methyltransferase
MDINFWLERWKNNEIGFHQTTINPYLSYFYGEKGAPPELRENLNVFVPLCGKTKDMLWLSQAGYKVFGVECSDDAVKAFFEENALNYKHAEKGEYALYISNDQQSPIEIFQGDFFALQQDVLESVTDVFDRAALVALPPEMRKQYVNKMAEVLKSGVRTLLVTLTYDQTQMDGPPFSVSEDNVTELYSDYFTIDKLCFKDTINDEPRMQERGLTSLIETVYKLTRNDVPVSTLS